MGRRIDSQIQEANIHWIKENGKVIRIEGYLITEFRCTSCNGTNPVRQDFPGDGRSLIYSCVHCNEEYLIENEIRNPISINVQDKEAVELYRQVLPILEKVRGKTE